MEAELVRPDQVPFDKDNFPVDNLFVVDELAH